LCFRTQSCAGLGPQSVPEDALEQTADAATGALGRLLRFDGRHRAFEARQFARRMAFVGRGHDVVPDVCGQSAAGDAFHLCAGIVADPHAGDVVGCESHEPRIAIVRGGAGFSRSRKTKVCSLAGAAHDHLRHHAIHYRDIFTRHDLTHGAVFVRVELFAAAIGHAQDTVGRHRFAAVGERRIDAGEFQRRDFRRAERDRQVVLEGLGEAETSRGGDDALHADVLRDAHGGGVERFRQRGLHRHGAGVLVGVVLRLPAADVNRRVGDHAVGGVAGLEAGEEHDRLERGARLAQRLGGAVKLAVIVVAPAHHGAHGAVRRDGDDGALLHVFLRAVEGEMLGQRAFGHFLEAQIEGGGDDEIAVGRADETVDLVQDPIDEVTAMEIAAGGFHHRQGLRAAGGGGLGGLRRDHAGLDHQRQRHGGAGGGLAGIVRRVVARRRAQEPREHRSLVDAELARLAAEVAFRCGFDAEGTGAHVHAVEIDREDLVLGELLFEAQRQQGFADLAAVGALRRQEQIARDLLGDGGRALGIAALTQVLHQRARDADGVDAEMGVEAAVFHREEGAGHILGQLIEAHRATVDVADGGDLSAARVHQGDVRAAHQHRFIDIRQPDGEIADHTGSDQAGPHRRRAGIERQLPTEAAVRRLLGLGLPVSLVGFGIVLRRCALLRFPHDADVACVPQAAYRVQYCDTALSEWLCLSIKAKQRRSEKRVVLDELAARLDHVAHQLGEESSASSTSLTFTCSSERAFSSSVVSQSCSGFISPRPL
jgi:hypothetical protein